ncbi:MAG TPA: S8 family serine peptidase [Solimonas sp.]
MRPTTQPLLMTLALLSAGLLAPLAEAAQHANRWSDYRGGEVLVQYRDAGSAALAKQRRAQLGMDVVRELRDGRAQLLRLPSITRVESAVELLRADPDVEIAEPNWLRRKLEAVPDDPLFFEQWGLRSTGQTNFASDDTALASIPGADMDLPRAWDRDGDGVPDRVGNGSVIVAVIDDAFDIDHPDLIGNLLPGRDTARNDNDPRPESVALQPHGTWVAGALGARGDNGIGIAGVAWNVKMLPIKVGRVSGNTETLDTAAILAAYDYARAQGASIVNASYGGPAYSELERQAIADLAAADILFVTAAGNEDSNTDYAVMAYPANYDLPNIVSVAASNRQDNIASFSQYGALSVDLAAPGLQIVTTAPGNTYTYDAGDRSASGISGTSFSSPYVAGIAALIRMEYPAADFREVKARLIEGAEASGAEGATQLRTVAGRANAFNSLTLLPQPSLVIRSVTLQDNGNQRLDPGETLAIEIEVENLWQGARNVQARLSVPGGLVSIAGVEQALGTIARNGRATARFTATVAASVPDYRELGFTLDLEDADGYRTQRRFTQELGVLRNGVTVAQRLSTGLYDEFHTYHIDLPTLPAGHNRLVFRSTAAHDIDLLIRRGRPAQYLITLAVNEDGEQVFETDADRIGGDEGGNETVTFDCPPSGTYYVTVVNYAQEANTDYRLTPQTDGNGRCDDGAFGRSGGGALSLQGLLLLLAVSAMQLLQGKRRGQPRMRNT